MNTNIPDFSKVRVLVVGDLMLDRYWHGSTSRISPEAPVPVVHVNECYELPGGAGNVALNLASLGCQTQIMGRIGDDEAGRILKQLFEQHRIGCFLDTETQMPTTVKLRVLSKHQQLIRLDFEEKEPVISKEKLLREFRAALKNNDVVILSDYAKGMLHFASELIAVANELKKPVFVDPKSSSFHPYRGATAITPNAKEFTEMAGSWSDEKALERLASAAIENENLQAILITRSEYGMTLVEKNRPMHTLRAEAQEVFDVTGAGDTVIAVLAASYAAGCELVHAMKLANVAAGIVVGKLGSATVSIDELSRAMSPSLFLSNNIVTELALKVLRKEALAKREKVVMTNGCFDLIHAGHIDYLAQAKALGDILIVAVNDDASVKRLKGPTRPIVPLAERMAVLAGLKSVDYVVSFSEDTPERLIESILPDVLVKGGDYQINQIAGAQAVLAAGGQVKVLSFKEGCSTTGIIKKIQADNRS